MKMKPVPHFITLHFIIIYVIEVFFSSFPGSASSNRSFKMKAESTMLKTNNPAELMDVIFELSAQKLQAGK